MISHIYPNHLSKSFWLVFWLLLWVSYTLCVVGLKFVNISYILVFLSIICFSSSFHVLIHVLFLIGLYPRLSLAASNIACFILTYFLQCYMSPFVWAYLSVCFQLEFGCLLLLVNVFLVFCCFLLISYSSLDYNISYLF